MPDAKYGLYPENLEQFARDCFAAGQQRVMDGLDDAERYFSLSNQAFNLAASFRSIIAESSGGLVWDALGNNSADGRFGVGISVTGYFGIDWQGPDGEVLTSETFTTADAARRWCEDQARGADTPAIMGSP